MFDKVFLNGRLRVGDRWLATDEAAAVLHGRIAAIGPAADLRARETVDLAGGYVLPGLIDAHVHPGQAGIEMNQCNLTGVQTAQAYTEAVATYAERFPEESWILGGGWSMDAFPAGTPTAEALDAVVPDRPVYLPNRDHHSAWVNTCALQLAGIDASTLDPADGRIERDHDGTPSGALHEGAMELVARLVPPVTEDAIEAGLLTAQRHLYSLGITGWQDALVGSGLGMPNTLEAYCRLISQGRLTARVIAALWWDRERGADQIEDLVARRDRAADAGLDASRVKIMQDGVCETFTAALLNPYLDAHGHPTENSGLSFIEPEMLGQYVSALEAHGFNVHFHALGDRAVRDSLDAIAAARAANGVRPLRHHLAHLQVVDPEDLGRFRQLDVTANLQMVWARNDAQMTELTLPFMPAEARSRQYSFRSLRDAGARLAAGSDWPVSTADPFAAIQVAVTRTALGREPVDAFAPLLPEQALTVDDAVAAYTTGSAYINGWDDAGSIRLGNLADFTVIDRDIFALDPFEICETRPTMTVVGGEVRYRQ